MLVKLVWKNYLTLCEQQMPTHKYSCHMFTSDFRKTQQE